MNPMLKKIATAVAVKKVIEKIQDARRPKRSLFSRMKGLLGLGAAGGGAFYLYKSGKLDSLMGNSNGSSADAYTPPSSSAPAAVTGSTASGTASTASTPSTTETPTASTTG